MYMSAGALRGQKNVSDPLKMESQVLLSYPMWMQRPEFRSFVREACALNCPVISPAPRFSILIDRFLSL